VGRPAIEALRAERTAAWTADERAALDEVVAILRPSPRHLTDILDWLDDVAVRDGVRAASVLAHPELARLLRARGAASDRLKRWKERLRRLRFPRLSAREEGFAAIVRSLELGAGVSVAAPPGLEGGAVTVTIAVPSAAALAGAVERLRAGIARGAVERLFALLDDA
jgi:hypothetical protein